MSSRWSTHNMQGPHVQTRLGASNEFDAPVAGLLARWRIRIFTRNRPYSGVLKRYHFTFGQKLFFHMRKKNQYLCLSKILIVEQVLRCITISYIELFFNKKNCNPYINLFFEKVPEPRITRIQVSAEFGCFQNRVPPNPLPRLASNICYDIL